jgi:hypothetical protein
MPLDPSRKNGYKPCSFTFVNMYRYVQGKNIGTVSSSNVDVNPDIEEGARLRHWYDEGGGATVGAAQLSNAAT